LSAQRLSQFVYSATVAERAAKKSVIYTVESFTQSRYQAFRANSNAHHERYLVRTKSRPSSLLAALSSSACGSLQPLRAEHKLAESLLLAVPRRLHHRASSCSVPQLAFIVALAESFCATW
jgi:hypothetical protein